MNIAHISYCMPENIETIASLNTNGEIPSNDALIFEKIMGLQNVPRIKSYNHLQQAEMTIEKLLYEYKTDPLRVKYFLFAHTADYVTPFENDILLFLGQKYGFKNAISFSTTLYKCACAFHLIQMANSLFKLLNNDDTILILTADLAFTEIIQYIPGSTVMGDAATAVLLNKNSRHHLFIDGIIETYGKFSKGIWGDKNEQLLFQSSYIENVCGVIQKLLIKNNISLENIKYIFPHNVNMLSWKQIIERLSLLPKQVYLHNISRTAHCFGSDPFINLKDAICQNTLENGDFYLLVTVGLGATFSALLFQY